MATDDIKQFIRDLNIAWQNHRYDDLYDYFHDSVAMLLPNSTEPMVGVEPMVESYRQFGSAGIINDFHIADLTVYEYETVAVCHMRFEVEFEIDGRQYKEGGVEVYVVDTGGGDPRVVWRTQIPRKNQQ